MYVQGAKPSGNMRAVCALIMMLAALPVSLAGGGNCKNECESAMKPFSDCVAAHCTQDVTACSDNSTATDNSSATACICPAECQECYVDLYGSKCGGCTNKNGYDFDKDVGPTIKAQAESMGCSGAAAMAPGALVAVVAVVIHALTAMRL